MNAREVAEWIARDASCAQGEFHSRVNSMLPYLTDFADEMERMRAELVSADTMLWLVVNSNGGYIIEKDDVENFPVGRAAIKHIYDPVTGDTHLSAFTVEQTQETK